MCSLVKISITMHRGVWPFRREMYVYKKRNVTNCKEGSYV